MERKSYSLIDILKIFFAVMIIWLHSQQKAVYYPNPITVTGMGYLFLSEIVSRLAVPFFFITSAYFLFKGVTNKYEQKNRVFRYCKRLFILYFSWFLIYFVYIIFHKLEIQNGIHIKPFVKLARDILLQNSFPASWYLMASITNALIIMFLTNKRGNAVAVALGVVCYVLCMAMGVYRFFMPENVCKVFDAINHVWRRFYVSFPYGIIFMVIGKILAENENKVKIEFSRLAWMTAGAFILLCAELFILTYFIPGYTTNNHSTYLMLPVASTLLVMTGLKSDIKYIPIYSDFRKASTIMYCVHGYFLWVLHGLITRIMPMSKGIEAVVLFFITLVGCLVVSKLIIKLSSKYDIIKYLY